MSEFNKSKSKKTNKLRTKYRRRFEQVSSSSSGKFGIILPSPFSHKSAIVGGACFVKLHAPADFSNETNNQNNMETKSTLFVCRVVPTGDNIRLKFIGRVTAEDAHESICNYIEKRYRSRLLSYKIEEIRYEVSLPKHDLKYAQNDLQLYLHINNLIGFTETKSDDELNIYVKSMDYEQIELLKNYIAKYYGCFEDTYEYGDVKITLRSRNLNLTTL